MEAVGRTPTVGLRGPIVMFASFSDASETSQAALALFVETAKCQATKLKRLIVGWVGWGWAKYHSQ